MYQNKRSASHIICVVFFNLKVKDLYRRFKNLVFSFLKYNILAVICHEYIAGAQFNRLCPALLRNIKWMSWCGGNCFAVDLQPNYFIRFSLKCLNDASISAFTGFGVRSIDGIPFLYFFNLFLTIIR